MKRSKWLWFVLLAAWGCGAHSDPGTDSSTQFWQTCKLQSDCDELSCVCGRCSQVCDEAEDCKSLSQTAVCSEPTEACESPAPVCTPIEWSVFDDGGTRGAADVDSASEVETDRTNQVFATVTVVAAPSRLAIPDGADSYVETYQPDALSYTCEPEQTSQFTRSDCPQDPSGSCQGEAQECRYLTTDTCAALHECLYGYWTMIDDECVGEALGGTLIAGTTSCADRAPIADSPCQEEGQICGHAPCVLGGSPSRRYTCTCGRWAVTYSECPRD